VTEEKARGENNYIVLAGKGRRRGSQTPTPSRKRGGKTLDKVPWLRKKKLPPRKGRREKIDGATG